MILRMFLYAIEELYLALGKEMAGSTIAVGGEGKKKENNSINAGSSAKQP